MSVCSKILSTSRVCDDRGVMLQMVEELLQMFGLPEDTPVTLPGFHYRDPTLSDPGVLTLCQALASCYDIRCSFGSLCNVEILPKYNNFTLQS